MTVGMHTGQGKTAVAESDVPRKYLVTVEAADCVRLKPRTLAEYRVKCGGPRFYRAGTGKRCVMLYTIEDLDAWVQQGAVTDSGA